MTPTALIDLAARKNAAHTTLIKARAQLRMPAGHNKMTEKDRDIDMELRTTGEREAYDNLCDEFAVWMAAKYFGEFALLNPV